MRPRQAADMCCLDAVGVLLPGHRFPPTREPLTGRSYCIECNGSREHGNLQGALHVFAGTSAGIWKDHFIAISWDARLPGGNCRGVPR